MTRSQASKPPSVSRRRFLHLMASAAAGASLTACAARPPAAAPRPTVSGKAQLVYQDSSAAWFGPMVVDLLEQFHATHPNIRVYYNAEPAVQADIEKTTMTQMESGTAADVIQGCCTWFPLWAQRKHLVDLRPYVAADIDSAPIADWNPAQYRALFDKDGAQFGLPKYPELSRGRLDLRRLPAGDEEADARSQP
jgi:ABC-type glycerol-3-phosphate transport system substrate-binding protein